MDGAKVLSFAALATAACARAAAPAACPAPIGVAPTRIVRFVPELPPGSPRDGKCWTRSVAAPRIGAWRCMLGNEIVDPCFSAPSGGDTVVCGADPATRDPGFAVHLLEPLPSGAVVPATAAPWLMLLANGQVCAPFTGTVPMVDGKEARWSCADASTRARPGLLTTIDEGTTWTAEWYPASEGRSPAHPSPATVPHERVVVTDVWE